MRQSGFTLLEILAALAITVIGIAAVVKVTGSAVDVLQTTEDRVLGSWVASNRLAELRLSRDWPAAVTRDASEKYGGRDWYYREKISETADPDLLRVDVSVYSDREQVDLSADMFGYIARYSPPAETALPWAAELLDGGQTAGQVGGDEASESGQPGDGGTNQQDSGPGSTSTSGSQPSGSDPSVQQSPGKSDGEDAGEKWWTKTL